MERETAYNRMNEKLLGYLEEHEYQGMIDMSTEELVKDFGLFLLHQDDLPRIPGHGVWKPREHDPVLEELEMKESYRDKVERQLKDGGPFKIKNVCTCLGTQVPSSCSIHNPMFEENI
jgi:hypothetical protein